MKDLKKDSALINFNRPFIVGKELSYIEEAVRAGHLAGDGGFTQRCHQWLEERFGTAKALLTHSCTAALEISAILCGIEPGDEVILPSYTFVSTANAFVLRGAVPRFVDIRPDTLNIDEGLIEKEVTPKTKAIVPVHYASIGCEMDAIMDIASRHDIYVVEDAAQAMDATYKEKYLGTIGHLGCFSFHETKNFIAGEGGALFVNDPRLEARAEIVREKGTNRSSFLRGEVDKYSWVDVGSSYLPSEVVAAFLFAQLESYQQITERRTSIFQRYQHGLKSLEEKGLLALPQTGAFTRHNGHMFYVLMPTVEEREALRAFLLDKRVHAVSHYVPLHSAPMGKKFGYQEGQLPVTEDMAGRILRLPCFFNLADEQLDRVVETIHTFFQER